MRVPPLHKILIGLWIFALSLSTMGVSVHAVYCYCKGEVAYAYLSPALGSEQDTDCCAQPATPQEASCCAPKAKSCCSTTPASASSSAHNACFDSEGCMETSSVTFLLKTDLLPAHFDLKLFKSPDFEPHQTPLYFFAIPAPYTSALTTNKAPPNLLPWVLSGREIGIRQQVFRC